MLQTSRANKNFNQLMDSAIRKVKRKGFDDIRSVSKDYDSPVPFKKKDSEIQFTPDITAKNRRGKHYFEIAQKTDDVNQIVSKWKLLSTMADLKNGQLNILIPFGQNKFTEQLVHEHDIKANLIKMD
ncbi:hypothetical protein [Acidiluteibacter ferrifornacis]|jgi:hypothetical protein|uniref:Uncharacterized protein n=1 Tax=Acidiluteibacter ferrifornacis TaxID=2692424 RepID=A0A6N9NGA1_9FLAO|nr:hypothetical protein [Acidiluteibacter ferrifornacis]MBR9832767.1 hypothetical protein [bacterium]NBG65658.1 hypothetical protein [Acidiluteibacter ferrifornacis]